MFLEQTPNSILEYQNHINCQLDNLLPDLTLPPRLLHRAMRYTVMSKGKRLRPLLVYAIGLFFKVDPNQMDNAACAVELIHCYSLVHDDLMDKDDYRRGRLSCHRAFDEGTAILVGDALQSLAFEVLARENNPRLVSTLAHASGSLGMVGGQQLDLQQLNLLDKNANKENIYRLKTGALFRAAVELGVLCAKCSNEILFQKFRKLGVIIGLIVQWRDDLDDRCSLETKTRNFIERRVQLLYKKIEQLVSELNGNTDFINLVINFLREKSLS
ncbi:polyprenyl synthetase family protein [Coxiella endosymbiont of Amblyomma sculptum]|uniref:polyprenyl synthetase family protein n=1 Tax=Coxiella endosymbiont of Amblyomma sculptum TaxID=2487929 RepID=UPI001FE39E9E|nr:polyprenyl synthetase family protein [Coxiella endosymbiont of Amblyomma sculptum]